MTEPEPALSRDDAAYAGQKVYTPGMLRAYDTLVVRLSNSLAWRCSARVIRRHYDRHLTAAHLDVGPGTGYYLDHCRFPEPEPAVTLLDANPGVLRYAADRISRYAPATHVADVLKPTTLPTGSFRSVGLNYVLHCLPGPLAAKAVVFDNLKPLVAPGGVVFGTTILGRGVRHNPPARALMRFYNGKGIFGNADDDLDGLYDAIATRFDRHELAVVGSVALFAAWVG
jgi:SAM-dependent methyltransferase